MAMDDKTAPFTYRSVIHIEVVPANTEGISGTSQPYLSFTASRNSLLFWANGPEIFADATYSEAAS